VFFHFLLVAPDPDTKGQNQSGCGSGSAWASRILIRHYSYGSGPDPNPSIIKQKQQEKPWFLVYGTVLRLRYDFLSLKSDVNSPSKSKSKKLRKYPDPEPKAARLEVRRQFFSQRVVEDWNGVPEQVKSAVSVIGFKAGLKKHLQGMMGPV
jgi:hypothetical protein